MVKEVRRSARFFSGETNDWRLITSRLPMNCKTYFPRPYNATYKEILIKPKDRGPRRAGWLTSPSAQFATACSRPSKQKLCRAQGGDHKGNWHGLRITAELREILLRPAVSKLVALFEKPPFPNHTRFRT